MAIRFFVQGRRGVHTLRSFLYPPKWLSLWTYPGLVVRFCASEALLGINFAIYEYIVYNSSFWYLYGTKTVFACHCQTEKMYPLRSKTMAQNISNVQTLTPHELIAASTLEKGSGNRGAQELMTRSTGFKVAEWIVGVLTLGIGAIPFEIYKSVKENQAIDLAANVVDLKNTLLTFKEGEVAEKKTRLHGKTITLQQDCRNRLTATFKDGQTLDIPFGALQLAEKLNKDIVSHPELYGKKAALDVLLPHTTSPKVDAHARSLFLTALEATVGEDLGNVTTIRTEYLGHLACKALAGEIKSASALDSFITSLQRPNTINAEDCLDLLQSLEQAEKADAAGVATSVILPKLDYTSKALEAQNPNITKVRNFVADIIYDNDTWTHDTTSKPGERLYHTLTKHKDTLLLLYDNSKFLGTKNELLDNAGFPKELAAKLKTVFNVSILAPLSIKGKESLSDLLDTAFKGGQLAAAESQIDTALETMARAIQEQITDIISQTFSDANKVAADSDLESQDSTSALAPSESSRKKLDAMLEASVTDVNSHGYGKFMKESMVNYFSQQAPIDKRAMIAASLRYTAANAPQTAQLGAFLKGAGPIMQKMLQGFNTANMDPIFADALSDMKTNLAPIHERIVKAQLYGMVQDSKGSITSIEVVKSLGAASVGQAFLCKVTTPQSDEPVDCVIKLLRPNVKVRADRERKIFEDVAKGIPGMQVTFAGQLNRIMDELDLTKEARNVEVSSVYDNGPFKNVHSMKTFSLIDASPSSMVLEKAPGVTIDAFYKTGKARIEEILSDSKGVTLDVGCEKINTLLGLYDELKALQSGLQNSAMAWVAEGVFGGGFYHGDLHAGNMMFDKDHGVTMIDYGNATALTPAQQTDITLMMTSAAAADTQKFLKGYRNLLSPEGRATFDAKKADLKAEVETIMSLGKMEDAGKRIALCLVTAAKMGIESPGPIFNFSQCQIRLQGTIDSMNEFADTLLKSIATILGGMKWTDVNTNKVERLPQDVFTKESIQKWIDDESLDAFADGFLELHETDPSSATEYEKELIALRDITKKTAEAIHPQVTFSDCMAEVLQTNMAATLNRIGVGGARAVQNAQKTQEKLAELEEQEKERIAQEKEDKEWAEEVAKSNQMAETGHKATEEWNAKQTLLKAQQNPQPQQV
ncbi:MAG: AarF/UbiB family protein [Bilophila sp.]